MIEKNPCDVVFLDFRKAFDTIPHPELLYKLWTHGITGPLWRWFQSYLSNRTHFVSVEGSSSSILPVRSGVPQGSVLGPLLFLLYVNDIPTSISFSTSYNYLFADDTKFMEAVDQFSLSTHIQQDLDSLHTWCSEWKLSLNSKKCAAMRFSLTSSLPSTYTVNSQTIKSVQSHKDLGITTTSNLSWSEHISNICAIAYRSLHLIRRSLSSSSSTTELRLHLYLTLVRSKLSYCSQLWRPNLAKEMKDLTSKLSEGSFIHLIRKSKS